jgi:hypothetical protein
VFKAGGKMFAVRPLEPAPVWPSFKMHGQRLRRIDGSGGRSSRAVSCARQMGIPCNRKMRCPPPR